MTRSTRISMFVVALVAVVVVALVAVVAVHPWRDTTEAAAPATGSAAPAAPTTARDAAALRTAFLDDYVQDGRVVRTDQGGDTVSEGQAYGLLIALAADDRATFGDVWTWTKRHLLTDDDLLAWRWTSDGGVADEQSASDADLDAARALVLAGDRFDEPAYTAAGGRIAAAVLDHETARTDVGRILLPGPWAATSDPYRYNASYASPAAYRILQEATGDGRWGELLRGSRNVTEAILAKTDLPSDWAQVHTDGTVDPLPAEGGDGRVLYGWDAMRMPLRYAESCSGPDRRLAGALAPTLGRTTRLAAQLDLGGAAATDSTSALAFSARAAAEQANGSDTAARADLRRADRTAATTRTYYGDAWAALGATMLTSNVLGGCATDGGSGS